MINSKNLEKVSKKLAETDRIIDILNSGHPVVMEFGNQSGVHKIVVAVSEEHKAVYDLSAQIAKAFKDFRTHLEREVQSLVRP